MHGKKIPIRVFIVAAETYSVFSQGCNLKNVISRLNGSQNVFDFVAVTNEREAIDSGLEISRRIDLEHTVLPLPGFSHVSNTQKEVIKNYVSDIDAFHQIELFITNRYMHDPAPVSDTDLIIVIDSNVYVPKTTEGIAELYGEPSLDSYSCLGNLVSMEDENNNDPKQFHGIAIISLARSSILFPEIWEGMSKINARAKIARYIIVNIAHFLAARSFGESLVHEHMSRCVAETNWQGGESVSYSARGLCEQCRAYAGKSGPANMFKRFQVRDLAKAINDITGVANKIDRLIEERKIHTVMIVFSMITLSLGVFANLLAGFEINLKDPYLGLGAYGWKHLPASLLTAMAFLVGLGLFGRWVTINRRLP